MPAPDQPLLVARQLDFTLPDGRVLLHDLNVAVGPGRTALVGANGIGKSTLLHILAGRIRPTGGEVVRRGRMAFLAQQPSESPGLAGPSLPTVAHALGLTETLAALVRIEAGSVDPADFDRVEGRWDVRERAEAALTRFGLGHLSLERAVDSLSGGESTRLSLCALLLGDPDLVVLDEPTNHLDGAGREALYRWVEEWSGTLLVVSHDRALLNRMDRIMELSGLGLRVYGGNFEAFQEQRAVEAAAAEAELEHARKELRKTNRQVRLQQERQERRTARAHRSRHSSNMPKVLLGARKQSGEATAGRLGGSGERQVARQKERLDAARERVELRDGLELALSPTGLHTTRRVLEVDGISYTPPGAAAPLFRDLGFEIRGPGRWAIRGPNGSGKSTLLRLLVGELEPAEGRVERGVEAADMAWLDQRTSLLDPDATILECFREANPAMDSTACRHALAQVLFQGDAVHARIRTLSGGERIRAGLACTVAGATPPLLLILDEPTNHLDLDSLTAVEELLRGYDGALVVVSHDDTFLEAIGVGQVVELQGPGGRR